MWCEDDGGEEDDEDDVMCDDDVCECGIEYEECVICVFV